MNIIVGASGQVGSHIIKSMSKRDQAVTAVVRNTGKGERLGVDFRVADLLNADQVVKAFEGGSTVFLLTPEDPSSTDIIGQTKKIIDNYRTAVVQARIKRIVGLSCVGAHTHKATGNIIMSRMLEEAFDDLSVSRTFIRPSYYYSNWLAFLEPMEKYGVMPTFFPNDLKLDMNSPIDVADVAANAIIRGGNAEKEIIEIAGPRKYSSDEVAAVFSDLLKRDVRAESIQKDQWEENLSNAGFTRNTAANIIDMTQAVIDRVTTPEFPDKITCVSTPLSLYLQQQLAKVDY